jgi:hypothetical protein
LFSHRLSSSCDHVSGSSSIGSALVSKAEHTHRRLDVKKWYNIPPFGSGSLGNILSEPLSIQPVILRGITVRRKDDSVPDGPCCHRSDYASESEESSLGLQCAVKWRWHLESRLLHFVQRYKLLKGTRYFEKAIPNFKRYSSLEEKCFERTESQAVAFAM